MTAERSLAALVLRKGHAPILRTLGIVTQVSPVLRVVPDGNVAEIGPIPVLNDYAPAVDDQVLLGLLANGSYICEGKVNAVPVGGGGGGGLTLIASVSGAGSYDLAVPQTHTHLRVVACLRSDESGTALGSINARFNNVSSNVYARHVRETNNAGNSTLSAGVGPQAQGYLGDVPAATAIANKYASLVMEVPFYRAAIFKECLARIGHVSGGSNYENTSTVMSFESTSAIESIQIMPLGFAWVSGSRLDVFGY